MSTVWELKTDTQHYRVAAAGNALRLYTNGVFHSQWNKHKPFSGHLWDLLSLPVFFQDAEPKLGAVLGVGGGAAIKTLHHFLPKLHIDAVDLDAVHIHIAKQKFECNPQFTHFFEENATRFIAGCKTQYDVIIDDLFVGNHTLQELAHRSVPADANWLTQLQKRLAVDGILIINFESENTMRNCVGQFSKALKTFQTIYCANTQRYENAIGIFSRQLITVDRLRTKLEEYYSTSKVNTILQPFEFTRVK